MSSFLLELAGERGAFYSILISEKQVYLSSSNVVKKTREKNRSRVNETRMASMGATGTPKEGGTGEEHRVVGQI